MSPSASLGIKLLLASQSATRRRMLEAAEVPFETVATGVDEDALKQQLARLEAAALAQALADAKALGAPADRDALVIGSDQVLERDDGSTMSKPGSRDEALAQLKSLSGRTHRLHAAASAAEAGTIVWRHVETVMLSVRALSDDFLAAYLDEEYEQIRWSVGGYRIEGPGVQLFDRVEGSHFAILGMPLLPLLTFLRTRAILAS